MPALREIHAAAIAAFLVVAAAGCGERGPAGDDGDPGATGSPGATPTPDSADTFVLTLTTASVGGTSRTLYVEFDLTDDEGVPRPLEDVSMNWTAAVLRPDPATGWAGPPAFDGYLAWSSYVTKTVSGTYGTTDQPTSDTAGTYVDFGGGHYRYQFSQPLPAGYDATRTHRIGVYARREDASLPDGYEIENDWLDFVPGGGPITETRQVVRTDNCNTCHDPLKAHGEFRREVELCVTCHNPDLVDPDTEDTYNPGSGNPNRLDLKVMVHRIHQGEELPSMLKAAARGDVGFKYSVIGYNDEENVFAEVVPDNMDAGTVPEISGVAFPRDQQNCTTCHTGGTDSGRHRTTVTREACGACHDSTSFEQATTTLVMDSHAGGVQASDEFCAHAGCHVADMSAEFDLSVQGEHVIPTKSSQLLGLDYQVVSAALVGSAVNLVFSVHNGDGSPVNPINVASFSITATVNGPTSDYRLDNYYRTASSAIKTAAVYDAGSETYSVTLPNRAANDPYFPNGNVIPAGSTGTFAVGLQASRTVAIVGFGNVTEGDLNPVGYFSVDGSPVVPRRKIVDVDTCNNCHDRLALHGGARREVEFCVMCHNPQNVDWAQRPKSGGNTNLAGTEDGIEERSINFRSMIHRLHTGEELDASRPYVIYGNGSSIHFFDEVRFPGDRRRCTTCHDEDTYLIESIPDDALPITANQSGTIMHAGNIKHVAGEAEIPPIQESCLGCHDTEYARVHAGLNTNAAGEEACQTCHGEDRDWSVRVVHGE